MAKKIIDETELREIVNTNMSLTKIAKHFNVCSATVKRNMTEYKIYRETNRKTRVEPSRDLIGHQFGRLTVLKYLGVTNYKSYWLCECSCEKQTILTIAQNSLVSGTTNSCGCTRTESLIKRNKEGIREFTKDQCQNIIQLYSEGRGLVYIAKQLDTCSDCIIKVLQNNNIQFREKVMLFNENYFNDIDTEHKAYWLGLLYADGYVGNYYLELCLKDDDLQHIKKFLVDINGENVNIKPKTVKLHDKEFKNNRIILCSPTLAHQLTNKGCMQNKSASIRFPDINILNEQLQNHFIRGFFDGDGSIGFYNNAAGFSMVSNVFFLLGVQNVLISQSGLNKVKLIKNKSRSDTYQTLRYGGNHNTYKFFKYLYKDATIFLDRKYDIFQQFLDFYQNKYGEVI